MKKADKTRKKILIVTPSFHIGGTIVSLHSLLSILDINKYEIDVFALNKAGEYLNKLPNCTILSENIYLSSRYNGYNKVKWILNYIIRALRFFFSKVGINIFPLLCRMGGWQMHTQRYDVVISYVESINNVVCYLPARKRIAWIHCDYKRYLQLLKIKPEVKEYSRYDSIVCVSDYAKNNFIQRLPDLSERVYTIHNVINSKNIRLKANECIGLDPLFLNDVFTIVSVGRLDPVKQFGIIPKIAGEVKKMTKIPFRWYIIGGSRGFITEETQIKKDIERWNLAENVFLLGEKPNVYPYMAKADLYVSTSISESFPLVINEAKSLGIPIVSNDFGSSAESIDNGVDGYIENVSSMAHVIVRLMENEQLLNTIKMNLLRKTYDNADILGKIERLL